MLTIAAIILWLCSSDLLRTIGDREEGFSVSHRRGDGAIRPSSLHAGEAGSADVHREGLRVTTRDLH